MAVLEKSIEKYLKISVEKLGGLCYKFVSPGVRGMPDRVCIMPDGTVFFAELKRPKGGVVAPHQRAVLQGINERGVSAVVLKTREEIDQHLAPWAIASPEKRAP